MLTLKWREDEDERGISRKQVINRSLEFFLQDLNETELMDNFYISEKRYIEKMYPELEVFVGSKTQKDADDERYFCIIRKKDA